jgi:hypothetical protein
MVKRAKGKKSVEEDRNANQYTLKIKKNKENLKRIREKTCIFLKTR